MMVRLYLGKENQTLKHIARKLSSKITYKLAQKEDYKKILSLYNSGFSANRSIEDLEWLYDNNPMGKGQLFIAILDDEVIGMQGIVKYQFMHKGKTVDTYKSEDSLINSNYRGKGIYKTLYNMVFKYIGKNLIWGLTDKKLILERTGMPSQYRFITAAIVNGIIHPSLFAGERNQFLKSLVYSLKGIPNSIFKNKSHLSNFKTEELSDFQKLEELESTLMNAYPNEMIPLLSKDIIDWRLKDNPKVKDWKIYVSVDDTKTIKGISMISINTSKSRWLSSYFTKEMETQDKINHIKDVQNLLFSSGIKIIEQWLFDNSNLTKKTKKDMITSGFKKIKNGLWIVNNGHDADHTVDDIFFSAQLGLD